MPFPLALIPAIIGAASATMNRIKEAREAKKERQSALELAKYQQEANQKSIDAQNAYNSPAMQMGRYNDAALNPNLIYGQGTPGNQQSIAPYEAPRLDFRTNPLEIPQMLGMYQDFNLKQAQIENVQAQTENISARTGTEGLRKMLMDLAEQRGKFALDKDKSMLQWQQDIMHGEAQRAFGKTTLQDQAIEQGKIRTSLMNQESQKRHNEIIFQEYEKGFREMGVTSSDNIFVRMLARMLDNMGLSPLKYIGGKINQSRRP